MNNNEDIRRKKEITNLFWNLLGEIDGLSQKDRIQINHYFKSADTSKKIVALMMVKDYILNQESKGKVECLKDQSHLSGKRYLII